MTFFYARGDLGSCTLRAKDLVWCCGHRNRRKRHLREPVKIAHRQGSRIGESNSKELDLNFVGIFSNKVQSLIRSWVSVSINRFFTSLPRKL